MKKKEEEPRWMHFCDDPKNKYFAVCNVANLKDIPTRKFMVPYETEYLFDTVQVKEYIYFSGGGVPASGSATEQFFKILMKFTIKADMETTINKLVDMNIARANHNMTALTSNALYVVGGTNSTGFLASCEEYLVDKNKWRQIASLTEGKKWVSVCGIGDRYLYAFGGVLNPSEAATDKIECIDTTDVSSKQWKVITLTMGADLWKKNFFVGALQAPAGDIMLFGGIANGVEADTWLSFDPTAKTMKAVGKIQRSDSFYRTKAGSNDNQLVIVGSLDGDLHFYDKTKKNWQLMRKTIWNPLFARPYKADTF